MWWWKKVNLEFESLGLLPSEFLTAKVTVGGGLLVDGLEEVKFLDDHTGTEIKVVFDDLNEFSVGLGTSTVGINKDGEGLGDTDGVGKLDKGATGKLGGNQRLCDPARSVGSRTVDLGPVLTTESYKAKTCVREKSITCT